MKQKHKGYWTKEKCHEEALKYNYRKDFKNKSPYVYKISYTNKWLSDITYHMINIVHLSNYWTKEKCHEEALKYNHRIDFQKNSSSVYVISHQHKWLDDICEHMEILGNKYKRCIYVFEFENKYVYVGLTGNLNFRKYQHLTRNDSSVYKFINKYHINYIFKQLTDYIDRDESVKKEEEILNEYIKNEWNILNKNKTGALGSSELIWTKEKCHEESLKYMTRTEFSIKNISSYLSAMKNKWLDEICVHMIEIQKPNGYWTKEKCHEESLKYKNKTDFKNKCGGAYYFASKHKFLNEICKHMPKRNKIINEKTN